MDPITQQTALAAAGEAGGEGLYVDDVFSTYLWDGTGAAQTITNGIDLSGEGGMVWIKERTDNGDHSIYDTERGYTKRLRPNTAFGENTYTNTVTSFNSDGFSLGDSFQVNESGSDFVSWTFRKAPGFFDVVTYTGTGSAQTIAHNLGSVPGLIIVKKRSGTDDWAVWHRNIEITKYLELNTTAAPALGANWDNTEPTSTNFTVGTAGRVNTNGSTYVAYIFAHDDQSFGPDGNEAIIKCGSYAGGTNGAIINIGFEPQFMMVKSYGQGGVGYGWTMIDSGRSRNLSADSSNGRFGLQRHTFVNNGVRWDSTDSDINSSGESYIYIAIRRPTKPITDGTKLYNAVSRTGTNADASITTVGFPPDLVITKNTGVSGYQIVARDRIRGPRSLLVTHDTVAENTNTTDGLTEFTQNGFQVGADDTGTYSNTTNNSGQTYLNWCFRRSAGFFDIVEYQGTGSAQNINHDLDVKPELIITKRLTNSESWAVYAEPLGATKRLRLNQNGGESAISAYWNDTEPTSSVFTVGGDNATSASGNKYIAYLFASVENVCKIGTYTGDGGNNNHIYFGSGYIAQPRFVLIKSTGTGDWVLVDSVRGISSGYDPYIKLNTDNAQVTGTNVIHANPAGGGNSSGFTPFDLLNTSGQTYLYLAIL